MKLLSTLVLNLLCVFLLCIGCSKQTEYAGMKINSDYSSVDSIEMKINKLLDQMTLEEKIGQMNQYSGFWDATGPAPTGGSAKIKYDHLAKGWVGSMLNVTGVDRVREVQKIAVEKSRLGIPLIIGFDVIHGFETLSPIPLAEAASWDLMAIKKSARIAAEEASAAGVNWTFAPMVDISRDSRWGRVMEGAGEDPFLGSKVAAARVRGFQGDDLSDIGTIAACAKHFAAYGFSEAGLEYNTVDIGTSTLYNSVLPPFKAAKDAGVRTFMNGFNELNGVPVTASSFLQRDILKGQWGFDGFVVSDWSSISEIATWGHAKDSIEAAEKAIKAGSDMDMESYTYVRNMADLVKSGKVSERLIDDAARRILRVKFELGLFDDPYKYCDETREKEVIGSAENREAVLDIAKKSIVLLKNENELLPLKKNGLKIGLIGALADDKTSPLGSWRLASKDNTAVSVLEGMQKYDGNKLTYAKGADVAIGNTEFTRELTINNSDKSGFKDAISVAKKSDVVVMVLGEHGFQSGEARSITDLGLPGVQQELLEAIFKVNKNIVLVLNNGRPLALPWTDENIQAIVEAWQLGTESGNAIAEVLYGDYNPSGKLPMSFPRNVGQMPLYYNFKNTGRPNAMDDKTMVFWSHYSDVEQTPIYPFGHGLSYTQFEYNDLNVEVKSQGVDNPIVTVSVKVTNTGKYDGKEVVQLYLQDPVASSNRPVLELKGFKLIDLKQGDSQIVEFTLDKSTLGFFNHQGDYLIEAGSFNVFVGSSSNTSLEDSFLLE